jgi:hypothetical protein
VSVGRLPAGSKREAVVLVGTALPTDVLLCVGYLMMLSVSRLRSYRDLVSEHLPRGAEETQNASVIQHGYLFATFVSLQSSSQSTSEPS